MNTMLQGFEQRVQKNFTKARWALGLSGVVSIAFGVAILVWPDISLHALVLLFGAIALARGIVGLVAAIGSPIKQGRGWLVLSSLIGIAVGVIVFVWTDMSALALLYVIGAYAVALGIAAIYGAFAGRLDGADSAVLGLSGLVSILFGVVIFAKPGAGALVLLALIAAYALVIGITEVVLAVGAKRILESDVKRVFAAPKQQPTHEPQPSR
jgi:uncharacterized membrane protein HdeD (DUF308 family)